MSNWFKHNVNARNDERVQALRMSHGIEGYGLYLYLIEIMHENMQSHIPLEKLSLILECSGSELARCESIVDRCVTLGLLQRDGAALGCARAAEQIEKRRSISAKRAQIGSKGGSSQAIAKQKQAIAKQTEANPSREEKRREEKKHTSPAVDPTEAGEFIRRLLESKVFSHDKILTQAAVKKWIVRRKTFTNEQLIEAFRNLKNEPDGWKLRHNGHRPLTWWLNSDERIEEMLHCHEKGQSKQPQQQRYYNPQLDE